MASAFQAEHPFPAMSANPPARLARAENEGIGTAAAFSNLCTLVKRQIGPYRSSGRMRRAETKSTSLLININLQQEISNRLETSANRSNGMFMDTSKIAAMRHLVQVLAQTHGATFACYFIFENLSCIETAWRRQHPAQIFGAPSRDSAVFVTLDAEGES